MYGIVPDVIKSVKNELSSDLNAYNYEYKRYVAKSTLSTYYKFPRFYINTYILYMYTYRSICVYACKHNIHSIVVK